MYGSYLLARLLSVALAVLYLVYHTYIYRTYVAVPLEVRGKSNFLTASFSGCHCSVLASKAARVSDRLLVWAYIDLTVWLVIWCCRTDESVQTAHTTKLNHGQSQPR
jgi:hypothetical protein